MKIPVLALLLQGIPECIALYTLAFVIAKIPLEWRKIIILGIFAAFISYVIRLFPITFGVHSIILIGLQFLVLIQIGRTTILTSLKSSLISFLVLVLLETSFIVLIAPLFGINLEMFSHSVKIRIFTTLPQVFILFILAFIIHNRSNKIPRN